MGPLPNPAACRRRSAGMTSDAVPTRQRAGSRPGQSRNSCSGPVSRSARSAPGSSTARSRSGILRHRDLRADRRQYDRGPARGAGRRPAAHRDIDGYGDYRVLASRAAATARDPDHRPAAGRRVRQPRSSWASSWAWSPESPCWSAVSWCSVIVRRSLRPLERVAADGPRRSARTAAGPRARSTSASGCRKRTPTPAPRSVRSAPR